MAFRFVKVDSDLYVNPNMVLYVTGSNESARLQFPDDENNYFIVKKSISKVIEALNRGANNLYPKESESEDYFDE